MSEAAAQLEHQEVKQEVQTTTNAPVIQEAPQQQTARPPMKVNAAGLPEPSTMGELFALAKVFASTAGQAVPKCFDTPEKVIVGWQLCADLGLPRSALKQVMIVNGVPSIWGDLPVALAHRHGAKVEDFMYDAEGKEIKKGNDNLSSEPVSAVCRVTLKTGQIVERSFTIMDAQKAKLLDKSGGLYKLYLKRMLQCRARGWALHDAVPECLNGVAIMGYDNDVLVDDGGRIIEETLPPSAPQIEASKPSKASEVNNLFGSKSEPVEVENAVEPEQA